MIGALGTGAELLLIQHLEDAWQSVPVTLLPPGILSVVFHAFARAAASRWLVRFMMILFLASGVIGMTQHYRAKAEFKLEMNPELKGWNLFKETIQGATIPPLLAPGVMIHLGLIGFACTYRDSLQQNDSKSKEL